MLLVVFFKVWGAESLIRWVLTLYRWPSFFIPDNFVETYDTTS